MNHDPIFRDAHARAFNVAAIMDSQRASSRSPDIIKGAQQAVALLASAAPDDGSRQVFMRELSQRTPSHFEWFYLLATLLALRDIIPADAPPPQAVSGASAQA